MTYAVLGYEVISEQRLLSFGLARNPNMNPGWASAYAELCPMAGIRTSIAFGQACHETGFFAYQGTAKPEWNNPAGLGVTGAPDIGNRFLSQAEGVRAHLGHLLWYFGHYHPESGFCDMDQRHPGLINGGHKNLPNDIRELGGNRNDGKGIRWAPAATYGAIVYTVASKLELAPYHYHTTGEPT